MWVALTQLTEYLGRTKRLSKRERLLPSLLELEHWTRAETPALLGYRACQVSDWNLNAGLSWVSSLQILGLSSLRIQVRQLLTINLSPCIYGSYLHMENPNTHIYVLTTALFIAFFFHNNEKTYHLMTLPSDFAFVFSTEA